MLIEVVVAAVLLVAVLGATAVAIVQTSSRVAASHVSSRAADLLNRKLTEVQRMDRARIGELPDSAGTEIVEPKMAARVPLRWTRVITRPAITDQPIVVTCSVEWSANGKARMISATHTINPAAGNLALASPPR